MALAEARIFCWTSDCSSSPAVAVRIWVFTLPNSSDRALSWAREKPMPMAPSIFVAMDFSDLMLFSAACSEFSSMSYPSRMPMSLIVNQLTPFASSSARPASTS